MQGGPIKTVHFDIPCFLSANVDRFSKFFHQLIRRKIIYVYITKVPSYLQYVATLPCEIGKTKNVTEFSR